MNKDLIILDSDINLNESVVLNNNIKSSFINIMKQADLTNHTGVFIKDKKGNELLLKISYYPMDDKKEGYKGEKIQDIVLNTLLEIPINGVNYLFYYSGMYRDKNNEDQSYLYPYILVFNIFDKIYLEELVKTSKNLLAKIKLFWNKIVTYHNESLLCRSNSYKGNLIAGPSSVIYLHHRIIYPSNLFNNQIKALFTSIISKLIHENRPSNIIYDKFVFEFNMSINESVVFNIFII